MFPLAELSQGPVPSHPRQSRESEGTGPELAHIGSFHPGSNSTSRHYNLHVMAGGTMKTNTANSSVSGGAETEAQTSHLSTHTLSTLLVCSCTGVGFRAA